MALLIALYVIYYFIARSILDQFSAFNSYDSRLYLGLVCGAVSVVLTNVTLQLLKKAKNG